MKILKVYDKTNRNIFQKDPKSGNIIIRVFIKKNIFFTLIINTKIFALKNDKIAYFSYVKTENDLTVKTLDLTRKYLVFTKKNKKGLLTHSTRLKINDLKSKITIDRIYDEFEEFLELENYKGKKTVKFKLKKELITNLLKHGQ